ncbi:MAG: phosphoribosylglycinamide formyltransferase [Bacteroidetes bacterium]|nr:MAG: phosphoribosylglycinamide formyltransferase [Bacteroidota bacterium]
MLEYFQHSEQVRVALLMSNNPHSGIFDFAPTFGVPALLMPPGKHRDGVWLREQLRAAGIDLVVLAGYLKLIPAELTAAFPDRILNIHPSLLPRFGGKGMYGMKVHESVISSGETESGMTIHYVNERYDEGEVLFQAKVAIGPGWTPQQLQQAVQKLEHEYFPVWVEKVCMNLRQLGK